LYVILHISDDNTIDDTL